MFNIYIIHPKLIPMYITQFCTNTIDNKMSILTYINYYKLYYILRFIFVYPNLISTYHLYYFVSFMKQSAPCILYHSRLILEISYLSVLMHNISRLHLRVSIISMYVDIAHISPV